jgi:putative DNA primase/helicase
MLKTRFLNAALAAAEAKFRVFPVAPGSKVPAIKGWHANATSDPKTVKGLWRHRPNANIGIVTGGQSGLFVLDVDGEEGRDSLQALKQEFGSLPLTVATRTPNGKHYYFRSAEPLRNNCKKLGPGLDGRGEGGYVVGAGSINNQDAVYRYLNGHSPKDTDIAEIPAWVLRLAKDPCDAAQSSTTTSVQSRIPTSHAAAALRGEAEAVRGAPEGTRNERLNSAAFSMGQLVGAGAISIAEVKAALISAAQIAGLEPDEIQATLESGLTAGQARPRDRRHSDGTQTDDPLQTDPLLAELARLGESDTDNGHRLVKRYGHRLHFVPERKEWFAFNGQVWREDTPKRRLIWAQEGARLIALEADVLKDLERRQARRHWAEHSLGAAAIRRALDMAQPHAVRSISEFDNDPWLLNVPNGTLDLRTGQLLRHNPADHLTQFAGTDYNADAKCPRFKQFLTEIFAGDKELIAFVRRFAGYTLTGDTSEQCFIFCQGAGRNGKSTLISILQEMLADYARSTPTQTLVAKFTTSAISNDLARLRGARLVSAIEANPNWQLDEALVKQITGGDRIAARFLYGEFFEFVPVFKLWFAANYPPRLRSTDDALWRRIYVLPFDVEIPKERIDSNLQAELRSELPGILAWAVRGCQRWREIGLKPPQRVIDATCRYRKEVDHVKRFLQECTNSNDRAVTRSNVLYERYERWCSENGERAVSRKALAGRLYDAGFSSSRLSRGDRAWRGVALRE